MNLSTYGADAVLDGTPIPATLYLKLHGGNPGGAGTANPAATADRQSFTRTAASGGEAANDAPITWETAAATENVSHVTAWDAASAGNCWLVGAVNGGPIGTEAGVKIEFPTGTLVVVATAWS